MSDIFAHINLEEEYAEMRAEIAAQAQQIDSQAQQIDSQAQQIDSLSQENKELRAQLAAKRHFPFNLFNRSRQ